jgi:hypothetical protein
VRPVLQGAVLVCTVRKYCNLEAHDCDLVLNTFVALTLNQEAAICVLSRGPKVRCRSNL